VGSTYISIYTFLDFGLCAGVVSVDRVIPFVDIIARNPFENVAQSDQEVDEAVAAAQQGEEGSGSGGSAVDRGVETKELCECGEVDQQTS
jgi:hypothetical protein